MKSLKYIVIVLLFFTQNTYAQQVGCRIGDYILITPAGNQGNLPLYSATNRIAMRNYAQDPQCGIDRNVAAAYPIAPGAPNNPSSNCAPNYNEADWGKLVYYKQSDNTCNVNLPLDDEVWLLLLGAAGLGTFFMYKNKTMFA